MKVGKSSEIFLSFCILVTYMLHTFDYLADCLKTPYTPLTAYVYFYLSLSNNLLLRPYCRFFLVSLVARRVYPYKIL